MTIQFNSIHILKKDSSNIRGQFMEVALSIKYRNIIIGITEDDFYMPVFLLFFCLCQ